VAYLCTLTLDQIQNAPDGRVATAALQAIFGSAGAVMMAIAIIISTFGCNNGLILAGARVYYAMAQDGLFFRRFASVHPRFETPYFSIVVFGVWSALIAVTGTYENLAAYAMYAAWVFYALTSVGVIALRRTQPDRPRPYRMAGYPATLIVFVLVAAGFIVNTFIEQPGPAVIGTLFILSGVPAYYIWQRRR
jgi:APA family basic amino acid/polyamine antiporter